MCFSVRQADVCAGKEKCILRKDAFWPQALTERHILAAAPHAKAHSAIPEIVQTALFRYAATREAWGNRPPGCEAL